MSDASAKKGNEVLFVLISEYVDWEAAILAIGLRRGMGMWQATHDVKIVTPDGKPALSGGGFRCQADYSFATVPEDYAGLVLVGGLNWWGEEAKGVIPLVKKALEKNVVLGAICDASMFLGVNGFLNNVNHTSNHLGLLKKKAGPNYTGESRFQHVPSVRDGNIVTANGVGFVEFTINMLAALGVADEQARNFCFKVFKDGMYPADMELPEEC